MGILYMNTADVGDLSLFSRSSGCTVSTSYPRTGTKSFRQVGMSSIVGYSGFVIPFTNPGYLRFGLYIPANSSLSSTQAHGVRFYCGPTCHLALQYYPFSSAWELTRGHSSGSTLLASFSYQANGVVLCIETKWNIADSGGTFEVKFNGVEVLSYTGDTRNASLAGVTYIDWVSGNVGTDDSSAMYIDDIIVRDDQWPMRGGIHVLVPNADGDTVSWTKSDVLKGYHEHINTQPPDYTDYLETAVMVAATKQLTHLTTLADDVWNIRGVGAHVNCKSTVSTDAFVRTLLLPADIGAAQAVGSDFGVESAASWAKTYYEDNPHDSAVWEKADIDDLQIGVETRVPA